MRQARDTTRLLIGVGVIACAGWVGALVQRAAAGGIPTSGALAYAGALRDANGEALRGSHNIEVKLWSMASNNADPLCATNSNKVTLLADGRFSVKLPDACVAQVQAHADIETEVLVDGSSLGRAPLSAVPYAIEAAHATSSDRAARADKAAAADQATAADSAANATRAANADALQGRDASMCAGAAHGHQLANCQAIQGPCGGGTFEQPTYYLDRVMFACPQDLPVMSAFQFVRCGELLTPQEGLAISATCCSIQ